MQGDVASVLGRTFGPPKRYAYSARPVVLYVKENSVLKRKKGFSVDFELACDIYDISIARGLGCNYNPHLVNIIEPGLDGNELKSIVSHSIFMDEPTFRLLEGMANKRGKLHKYNGVVDGYPVREIKQTFDLPNMIDTGICMTDAIITAGCLKKPRISFDENKHLRFIQASQSYVYKLMKHSNQSAVSRIFHPEMLMLNWQGKLEVCNQLSG